jgi:hypothetical protein
MPKKMSERPCKHCRHHWVAGHKTKKAKGNDWCCYYGKHAPAAYGRCKLEGRFKDFNDQNE